MALIHEMADERLDMLPPRKEWPIACVDMPEQIVRYVIHDLSISAMREVERHVRKCPGCRAKLAALEIVSDMKK